jgi:hypothetical protein
VLQSVGDPTGNAALLPVPKLVAVRRFLLKIWGQIIAVPAGIAIIDRGMSARTIGNIFYEMGLMHAYGKETLVVKTRDTEIPSDFVRTEYVQYGDDFGDRIRQFMTGVLELAEHYGQVGSLAERNPLLAIDYFRRAYLISGDPEWQERAREVADGARQELWDINI